MISSVKNKQSTRTFFIFLKHDVSCRILHTSYDFIHTSTLDLSYKSYEVCNIISIHWWKSTGESCVKRIKNFRFWSSTKRKLPYDVVKDGGNASNGISSVCICVFPSWKTQWNNSIKGIDSPIWFPARAQRRCEGRCKCYKFWTRVRKV